jgi:hypothetical protein
VCRLWRGDRIVTSPYLSQHGLADLSMASPERPWISAAWKVAAAEFDAFNYGEVAEERGKIHP